MHKKKNAKSKTGRGGRSRRSEADDTQQTKHFRRSTKWQKSESLIIHLLLAVAKVPQSITTVKVFVSREGFFYVLFKYLCNCQAIFTFSQG